MVAADFIGKTVCLDTSPFIYFIEGSGQYHAELLPFFKKNTAGNVPFITSCITLMEMLVKPLRDGDAATAKQYKEILTNSPTLRLFDVDVVTANEAARLRALYNFRTPDSIQLCSWR